MSGGGEVSAIEVSDLHKSYTVSDGLPLPWRKRGERLRVLRGVSLRVEHGETYGLLGPNGAGKSTLMKILATLVTPDAGSARIDGHDVTREPGAVRGRLGIMLEQERSFLGRLTGRQNLEFFAALYGAFGAQAHRRIDELLDLVGLIDAGDRWVQKYSLGMQHRLALARALIPDPSVLLLDEPTRSLDPDGAHELCDLLRRLAGKIGKAVFLLSHDLETVKTACDRIGILHRGRLLADGRPEAIGRELGCVTLADAYSRIVAGDHADG